MKVLLPVLFCLFASSACMDLSDEDDRESVEPEYLDMLWSKGRYDEFNRLLDIDNPHLSRPRPENATWDPRYSPHLPHGDILFTRRQTEQARQGIKFNEYPRYKWPNRKVPYTLSSDFTAAERKTIIASASEFNIDSGGCINWVPRVAEADYVYIYPGPGCWSRLGRNGKQQPLCLQKNGCIYKGTILHEMNHAIGVVHEQCRTDRDDYITVLYENINQDWKDQYDKASYAANLAPYDYYSIMHYPQKHSDVSNNKPAYTVKDPSVDASRIGSAQAFSAIDKQKIQKLYC